MPFRYTSNSAVEREDAFPGVIILMASPMVLAVVVVEMVAASDVSTMITGLVTCPKPSSIYQGVPMDAAKTPQHKSRNEEVI